MNLSNTKIASMWEKLENQISYYSFSHTTFINNFTTRTKILSLFTKNGEPTIQLEQIGFIICSKTIFQAQSDTISSDRGVITNDYFVGEIIDVNNTLLPGVYIHLVKVISGPIVINDIPLQLSLDEDRHKGIVNNTLGWKLFDAVLNKNLRTKNKFNSTIDNQKFVVTSKNLKLKKQQILSCEAEINVLLSQQLPFSQLLSLQIANNSKYYFLKALTQMELMQLNNLQRLAVTNIMVQHKQLAITVMSGTSEDIEKWFTKTKKPIINGINILNKKIRLINQPDIIKPVTVVNNITNYQNLFQLQLVYKRLKIQFHNWRKISQPFLESQIDNMAYGYYSEAVDNFKFVHYSFNNDLLDDNLMEIKGRKLLADVNNTILFLTNNVVDNPSMIILMSNNISSNSRVKTIISKTSKLPLTKIKIKHDIIIFSTSNYQTITNVISEIISVFKKGNYKYKWQLK
ncbi:hypothetical protein [Spiroplasma sp. AdecLV25b]|uniref:hypothetical protein n=1 Tax=Spiroplasma sp. AdecLV25b TaxID=3027162 RepID=UPI0027E1CC4B|nr:hypothetical protein [Spiroplasma sp. AdecLV25b]